MTPLEFILATFAVSVGAGIFGAVLGLGGGIIVVPALTLLLHVDIRYAIGASIVSVIATSSGAGAVYVKEGLTNIRVSMLLETATTSGAILGAFVAGIVHPKWLFLLFGLILSYSAFQMWRGPRHVTSGESHADLLVQRLSLGGSYFDQAGGAEVVYHARRPKAGLLVSSFAGVISGLLGVGGGVIKVPTMNLIMGLPLKVASATSNFMIGVTAAASAGVYFYRGDINPIIAAPVAVGVAAGALIGTIILRRMPTKILHIVFTAVLLAVAAQMLWRGLT
ncbi:MAG: sulfite exporter TauE/SafE family protein [Phycisphaerae bacterium]